MENQEIEFAMDVDPLGIASLAIPERWKTRIMRIPRGSYTVLVADDDADDRFLIKKGWPAREDVDSLQFVEDGEELLDYLYRRNRYAAPAKAPTPDLILLDLNMSRKGGREVLQERAQHLGLRSIPVVVLTTSQAEEDIAFCHETGANSYIAKPTSFHRLREILETVARYWFEAVEIPIRRGPTRIAGAGTNSARLVIAK